MTDLANLVLAVDSSQVKTGTAALDGLTAAGTRAELAAGKLGTGVKGAAAQATAMAAAAQASARGAIAQAAGFEASASAARLNTIAMRETLVVAREISRGNLTRIPGSLSLLAANVSGGFSGFAKQLLTMVGVIKTVQNAELSAAAASAVASANSIRSAAERAGANILAADTELALAQAAVRTAEGSEAEAAAQARVAAAHEAVAAAAAEATVAENALALANGRAAEASAASAAATRTVIGGTGIGLIGIGAVALVAYGAIKQFQDQVKGSGELDSFAEGLRLSDEQIKKMGGSVEYLGHNVKEITGLTVTMGDVMAGVWQTIKEGAEGSAASNGWMGLTAGAKTAFDGILAAWNKTSAALSAGIIYVEDRAIAAWQHFPAAFADVFVQAVNLAITALNGLVKHGTDLLNGFIGLADKIPGVNIGKVSAPQIGLVNNPNAGAAARGSAAVAAAPSLGALYAQELKRNGAFWDQVEKNAIQHRKDIMQKMSDANNPAKGRTAKPNDHGLEEALEKLRAEIDGQLRLADAYLVSDAAALKAIALQKAEEDAIKHKSQTGVFYELELQKIVATAAAEGAKKVADLRFEADARAKVNSLVAAGIIPAAQANDQLKLETELRPLEAALAVATGAAKQKLLDIIRDLTTAQADLNTQTSLGQALQDEAANDNQIAKLQLQNQLLGASNMERATAIAQLEAIQKLQSMPGLDPAQQQQFVQSYVKAAQAAVQTPFQQWAATVPQTAQAVSDALQTIEFKGFDSLGQAITDVLTGTKSLSAAFSDMAKSIISDILQMTIKMLIFRAVSSIFGGSSASLGGSHESANFLGSAKGNVFSGGNVVPFALGGIVSSPTLFPMANGTGLMGEAGPEAVMPLARDSQGRLGVRANDNQSGPIEIKIGFGDAPEFAPYVQEVAGAAASQAVKISVDHTNRAFRTATRPKLNGR